MSILWYDGFDHYGDGDNFNLAPQVNMGSLWSDIDLTASNSSHPSATQKRTGPYACQLNTLRRSLGGDKTRVGLAMGFYMPTLPSGLGTFCLMQFRSPENRCHVTIQMGSTGRLYASRMNLDGFITQQLPGVPIGNSEKEMAPGTWNHIEVWITFDETAGTIDAWVNGVQFLAITGAQTVSDTGSSGKYANITPVCAQVAFGIYDTSAGTPFGGPVFIDDLVAMDGNTTAADGSTSVYDGTTPLGQYGVYYQAPNADTTDADWSLSSGTHGYQLINDAQPDDDVNFIFTGTVNAVSRFGVSPLPANVVAVAAVMNMARVRKTDTGNCRIKLGVDSGGTIVLGGEQPLVTSYGYLYSVFEQDPADAAPWTPTVLPTIEVKRTA